ncbi:CDP-diacylglycerol-serine O-phosphatidyltransferase [uncultured Clostridium sp.]|uniref:CDP-diacylglycerol--serine O-phosphatidyltransferase n=1 Tax=uncultured Clostridium sp. TaxID=59620 RepID=UPI000821ABAA|nr:CDP-diacylglycerol--serine O-phosphatidyltransferase [uncultured Clostridium sp.]SCJ00633.1 CDP-diacylglycerol-serine O-phosphatidyltransferase [uncultured Clostridium sp.]
MKRAYIPNAFTFINLSLGICSILSTMEGNYALASTFIILAGLVDRYDGRIARFLNASSELGKELDSLADLVSFGVAPSILSFILFNFKDVGPTSLIGFIVLITFPICGAFRLARYNVSTFDGVFAGVPITIAGCFIALFILLTLRVNMSAVIPMLLMIVFSYLMVSNFKLKKF